MAQSVNKAKEILPFVIITLQNFVKNPLENKLSSDKRSHLFRKKLQFLYFVLILRLYFIFWILL
ncbi:MAG: hypothetical protein B7Y25_08360 [Alphaproteobacteria bacterium 16-39-46]|nr:MAG: hypothetical protein B7Y25_08360 [Alphaproteobacteria bacterium 16-39-46]OZA41127.1 MAG: hypothetical protein B7X84_08505 [Alphaproteobacteria bacterium 17-39-52]